MKGSITGLVLAAGVTAMGCAPSPSPAESSPPPPSALPESPPPPAPRAARPPIDGRAFPDKVLALTWDDGPDTGTLELARYLHAEHVSATFFVVSEWIAGVSEEPGKGHDVFETGHAHLPVLGELVRLGHRLGNHTLNHVLLSDASARTVGRQLRENQARIDPFITSELRLFRAPGGAWSASASAAVDADPTLQRLVGPVHWDMDGKDWEGSLYCRSSRPAAECEHAAPDGGARVKASVTAQRYLSTIDSAGHGIVLLHDRVGHVGSDYALHVAHALIPQLKARGYVFAAPVLRFSPLAARGSAADRGATLPADVDGDGRADLCERRPEGIFCALADGSGRFGASRRWSNGADFSDGDAIPWAKDVGYGGTIRFGDINGDGRADVCGRGPEGVVCALSTGRSFSKATNWLPEMSDAAGWLAHGATIQLRDVNGDGRADVCGRGVEGRMVCGLAP